MDALYRRGWVAVNLGDDHQAHPLLAEALPIARRLGLDGFVAAILDNLAPSPAVAKTLGEAALYEEALALSRARGWDWGTAEHLSL